MGFSTVAAQAIFFIVVILAAVSISAVFTSYMDSATTAAGAKSKALVGQIGTDITITDVIGNATNFTVYAAVKGVGVHRTTQ